MLAFTFPGQGSQRPGMGREWLEHPSWELVADASDASGRDVAWLLLEAPMEELTETANAQLATYVASLVVLDAVERLGLEPVAAAGHSLGEYSALTAAGAISFEEGVRLVCERGEAMRAAAEARKGTMVALLGATDDAVDAACQRVEGDVWVANYNAPGQVVIAGEPDAVKEAAGFAKEMGARKIMQIPVGGAFHTPLMEPARSQLRKALEETSFTDPDIEVTANVDARVHLSASQWPGLLSAQLCSPVRWRQSLLGFAEAGVTTIAELGPGGVLTGLARRTLPEVNAIAVSVPSDLEKLVSAVAGDGRFQAFAGLSTGERVFIPERVVVSPAGGVFSPEPNLARAVDKSSTKGSQARTVAAIQVGSSVGKVNDREALSPFSGQVIGFLAKEGERVTKGQPLAWLRVTGQL